MLEVRDLTASYGRSQVLFGVDFDVPAGKLCTLIGKNGMGKTTTVRTLFGLTDAIGGSAVFEGRSLVGLKPHQVARLGIGLVPEGRQIFPTLTVIENLCATANLPSRAERVRRMAEVLELFPRLDERRSSYGGLLSGGEQQMLAIGRALMTDPKLLVLDEATEGLAPTVRREIWQALSALKEDGLSILIIDKSLKPLCRLGDRHYILEKGRIVWSGESQALADPAGEARALLSV